MAACTVTVALHAPHARAAFAACPGIGAHRGQNTTYPENTLPAWDAAYTAGARLLEGDIRFDRSGFPEIVHDGTLDRTTNITGAVASRWVTALRLPAVSAGYPQKFGTKYATVGIPLEGNVMWALRWHWTAATFLLELKDVPATAAEWDRVFGYIDQYEVSSRVILYSFSQQAVRYIRAHRPDLATGLAEGPVPGGVIRTAGSIRSLGGTYVVQDTAIDGPALVAYWHAGGVRVDAWVADDVVTWKRLAADGVDVILTDDAAGLAAWEQANC